MSLSEQCISSIDMLLFVRDRIEGATTFQFLLLYTFCQLQLSVAAIQVGFAVHVRLFIDAGSAAVSLWYNKR